MTRTTRAARGLRPQGREWVWALSAAGLVLNGLRLRGRIEALRVIDRAGTDDDDADAAIACTDAPSRFVLFTVEGATVTVEAEGDARWRRRYERFRRILIGESENAAQTEIDVDVLLQGERRIEHGLHFFHPVFFDGCADLPRMRRSLFDDVLSDL